MEKTKPKYQLIIDWITEGIQSGQLKQGDRLMPENDMCEQFGLCRQTVRRALGELENKKILTRVQGSGTYIGTFAEKVQRNRYMNIAVLSTFYESYIFPPTLRGIEKSLSNEGYSMQVSFTDNNVEKEEEILKTLLQKDNVDGIIAEPSQGAFPNRNLKYYRELKKRGIPVIFFNDAYPELDFPCVRLDDYTASHEMTKFLIQLGHTKIAGIFKVDDGQGVRRYQGYLDALKDAGIRNNPGRVFWMDTTLQSELYKIEDYIFERIADSTGLVCYNDEVAKQMIDCSVKRGIQIPEELSIVGIDDSELARISKLPFASYVHPKEKLGSRVAENLMHMIGNPLYDGNYLFVTNIEVRESVKRVN